MAPLPQSRHLTALDPAGHQPAARNPERTGATTLPEGTHGYLHMTITTAALIVATVDFTIKRAKLRRSFQQKLKNHQHNR